MVALLIEGELFHTWNEICDDRSRSVFFVHVVFLLCSPRGSFSNCFG
jgi:hypothetical protein